MPSRDNRIENDRIARRAARAAPDSVELYEAPPSIDCDVDTAEYFLSKDHYIHVTLRLHEGRLVGFFMAWMARDRDGEWSERYSVCTSHGYLHEHTTGHHRAGDRIDIHPLRSQVDVQEGHDRAYELVHSRYIFAVGGS